MAPTLKPCSPTPADLSDKITKLDDHYCDGGCFGDVWKCLYTESSSREMQVAVKALRFKVRTESCGRDDKAVRIARRELGIWRRLDHENVVPFLGIAHGFGPHVALVSLWMPHGTLRSFVDTHTDRLSIPHRLQLLLDISNGLVYLHSQQFVHGDLTSNNVLIDENYHARLTDFGLASLVGEIPEVLAYLRASTVRTGAIRTAAPELFHEEDGGVLQRTTKSDIYSYGNIAYLVFSGKEPWSDIRQDATVIRLLLQGKTPSRPSSPPISDEHWALITECWLLADKRPTAEYIVTALHRFIDSHPLGSPLRTFLEPSFSDSSDSSIIEIRSSQERARDYNQESSKSGPTGDLAPQKKHDSTPNANPDCVVHPLLGGEMDELELMKAPQSLMSSNPVQEPVPQRAPRQPRQIAPSRTTSTLDLRSKKRTLISDPGSEVARPLKRRLLWPSHNPLHSVLIKSDDDPGIKQISFDSKGEWLAVACNDRTIRIWNTSSMLEMAKLVQNMPITAMTWMSNEMGIMLLKEDGSIIKWARAGQYSWQSAKLLDASPGSVSFAYRHDRIAVAHPQNGVNVYTWVKGIWQSKQQIMFNNATYVTFVEDGEALVGGTSDGVFWYSHISQEKSCTFACLDSPIYHLDVNVSGTHALISQEGGWLYSVRLPGPDQESKIEQTYASQCNADGHQHSPGAVFTSRGKAILFGLMENHLMVWDMGREVVLSGLAHPDGEQVRAVAAFDGGPHGCIVTGTKDGRLSWWKPLLLE